MKVYVAGSSRDLDNVKSVQTVVGIHGHSITYDWVPDVEKHGPGQLHDSLDAVACAMADLNGVMDSDLVIVVAHERCWGAMLEIGAALAYNTPVWVLEEWETMRYSIFFELTTVTRFESLEAMALSLAACSQDERRTPPVL